jgi:septal ring factor EnvC (AmiA/AmiB activator)
MTVEDATKLGALFATVISSLLGWLTWTSKRRDDAVKLLAETTEQRMAREEATDLAKQTALDTQMWNIIHKLEADVKRLDAERVLDSGRISSLNETIAALRGENISVRGDLAAAQYTITMLSQENDKLKARVHELERHEGQAGGC